MRNLNLNILAAVCVFMMTLAVPAAAVTHYISPSQSIQAAIGAASNGDEIEVAPGTYNEAINFNGKAVRLYSNGGPEVTTINGTGHYHVVQCISGEDTNTILEGFTITGGDANGPPGEDRCGGGMYNYQSSPTISNCIFVGNTAHLFGGAVSNRYSNPVILNCKFFQNSTNGDGGAMHNDESSPIIINSIFTTNSTRCWGGAIRNIASSGSIITNCLFVANTGPNNGGAISNWSSTPNIINCTFTQNSSADGAAIYGGEFSSATIYNSVIWGNKGPEISGNGTDVSYSDIEGGWSGEGNINVDPYFVEPGYWDETGIWIDGDYHLLPYSPCIDVGDPNYIAKPNETDLDGKPRVIGGRIDIGAFEFQGQGPRIIHVDDDAPADFNNIQAAINDANNGDIIEVQPGTYTGAGNRDINFEGKHITLRSLEGPHNCVIDCQFLGRAFYLQPTPSSPPGIGLTIQGFTITGGYAPDGGAISCHEMRPVIIDCIFQGNRADRFGGALYSEGRMPVLVRCIFKSNFARIGGAIYNSGGNVNFMLISNCVFNGNWTLTKGGAIFAQDGISLTNCTLVGNFTFEDVGGILSEERIEVRNCILWDNRDSTRNGNTTELAQITGSPVYTYHCCIEGWSGSFSGYGNIGSDPCLFSDQYHLKSDSSCIDAGINNAPNLLDSDMDGHPRIIDGDCDDVDVVDMGAYEFNYAYMGDLDYNCSVDFFDFSIFAGAWMTQEGDPDWDWACDISDPPDDYIDWRDAAVLCDNWLIQIP